MGLHLGARADADTLILYLASGTGWIRMLWAGSGAVLEGPPRHREAGAHAALAPLRREDGARKASPCMVRLLWVPEEGALTRYLPGFLRKMVRAPWPPMEWPMMEHFSVSKWSKRDARMRCSSLVT